MPSLTDRALTKSLIDAKGDIVVGSADDSAVVLTAGTDTYYLKANSATSFGLEWASVTSGASTSSTPPVSPTAGNFWFNQDTAQTFLYYDSQWIEVGASGMAVVVSTTAPTSPISGLMWYNSDTGGTYVYYNTIWVEVGAAPFNFIMNLINAKGDLLVGSADNTLVGVTAGTNGQVLTAASGETAGVQWATPTVYAAINSPTFTGVPAAPTATAATNTTQIATTAFVTTADDLKANIAGPTFTGTPAAPTASAATNTTQIATTAFVRTEVSNLVASAPSTLDTLNELALALGSDASFSTTVTNSLAAKAPLADPTFTGTVTIPTPYTIGAVSMTATGTELNYVEGVTSAIQTQLDAKATMGKSIAMSIVFGGG